MSGQWLVFENSDRFSNRDVNAVFYSKAVHASTLIDIEYPPAEIQTQSKYIIAFETEEDATAFKLRWDRVNVC